MVGDALHDIRGALFAAVDVLDELRLRYAVVCGLAVGAWGVNRSTRDADLYVELSTDVHRSLLRALKKRGFHVPAMEEELERFGVFRSRSGDGVFVDIFSAAGPLGEAVLDRRRSIELDGRSLWFVAPEDLAILKAFSERPRDFEDLVSLSSVIGSKLDVAYIRRWAKRLDDSIGGDDVSERLERALAQKSSTASGSSRRKAKKKVMKKRTRRL